MDPPGVEEDRGDDDGHDHQPQGLVLLDAADVVGEPEPAHAARTTREVVLGGCQDLDGGGEPERADEHAVRVQVGDQPSDEEPGHAGDEGCGGGADEEHPRLPERPVDLHVQHAEGVHPDAPEPDDAEVGDPGETQLEVEQQREADHHHDLEQPRDQEGVGQSRFM